MEETAVTTQQGSKGLRIAFGVLATLAGLAVLILSVPFALASLGSGEDSVHRIHNVVGLFTFGGFIGLAVLVAAWRPATQVAAFQAVLAATVASTAASLLAGDFISGSYWPGVVIVVILIALHPARRNVFREAPPIWPLVILGLVSLVPAVLYALAQAKLQREGVMANPHVELHHYSGMAAAALAIALVSFIGACRTKGRRFVAWTVGVPAAVWGVLSVAYAKFDGALSTPWNWMVLAWGVLFIILSEVEARKAPAG